MDVLDSSCTDEAIHLNVNWVSTMAICRLCLRCKNLTNVLGAQSFITSTKAADDIQDYGQYIPSKHHLK